MFGLTFEKLFIAGIIAAVILGPEKLPYYAQRLGVFIRALRSFVDSARARAEAEAGISLRESDWQVLDPRQYDPRRIVREAFAAERDAKASAFAAAPDARGASTEYADEVAEVAPTPKYIITGSSGHPRRILVTPGASAGERDMREREGGDGASVDGTSEGDAEPSAALEAVARV